jgi:hypothetical protein
VPVAEVQLLVKIVFHSLFTTCCMLVVRVVVVARWLCIAALSSFARLVISIRCWVYWIMYGMYEEFKANVN